MDKGGKRQRRGDGLQHLFLFLTLSLTILLGTILWSVPETEPGLAAAVAALQDRSGLESPVTAVLLNFRGYDTLLEVIVLLLAVIGSWSLTRAPQFQSRAMISPVQMGVVRLLVPVMCLVAADFVWQGSYLAGGAFQGGAILGAAGVLLLISDLPWLADIPPLVLRIGLIFGPLIFIVTALLCFFLCGSLLRYPEGTAAGFILLIESACALSIGLTLTLLFAGGHPRYECDGGRP